MIRVFLDTNILVDLIADRQPYSKFAIEIFMLAEKKKIALFTSSHSIVTTHYLLKKYMEEKSLRKVLVKLLEMVSVVSVDEKVLKKGLLSKHKDFEDAIQILCAANVDRLYGIVTRNPKDFKTGDIPVFTPNEFLSSLE